jgi:hypothetical protein
MTDPLAIITPTRRRWPFLLRQAAALAPQLSPEDRWIIGIDNDEPEPSVVDRIHELVGDRLVVWAHFAYERPEPPFGIVNRLRNALAAFAPDESHLVELDDDDLIERDALAEFRAAFAAGYDYIFGWHRTVCMLEHPNGEIVLEKWPDERPIYQTGAFVRRECQPCGVRAIRRSTWEKLAGWQLDCWPAGNIQFAMRAEAEGAAILCVEKPLCEVTIALDGISTRYRRLPQIGKPLGNDD